ncbi:1-deoxy-D-xylulose-5-phosphate synthase, partial [Acetobacter sicerae]|nr:1-deoxy-D-xylulose-5-phosphate synthase [Acetobacter sicerae]
TIEEGSVGGFGSFVAQHLSKTGLLDHVRLRTMTLPDMFIDHDSQFEQYNVAHLNAPYIVQTALAALGVSASEQIA